MVFSRVKPGTFFPIKFDIVGPTSFLPSCSWPCRRGKRITRFWRDETCWKGHPVNMFLCWKFFCENSAVSLSLFAMHKGPTIHKMAFLSEGSEGYTGDSSDSINSLIVSANVGKSSWICLFGLGARGWRGRQKVLFKAPQGLKFKKKSAMLEKNETFLALVEKLLINRVKIEAAFSSSSLSWQDISFVG